jgi:predicted nucleic acid-binding protein
MEMEGKPSSFCCVDASFALKLVIPENGSAHVAEKWKEWLGQGIRVTAPWIFAFETMSVIRRKVARREFSEKEGLKAWKIIWGIGIELKHHEEIWNRSWKMASKYHRPTIYDVSYLALAEALDCELWTADMKFIEALVGREPRVRGIEDNKISSCARPVSK